MKSVLVALLISGSFTITASAQDDRLFWVDQDNYQIKNKRLDGTGDATTVTFSSVLPTSMDVDVANQKLYWFDQLDFGIKRSNLDGSNVENIFFDGESFIGGMDLDVVNSKLYFSFFSRALGHSIRRMNLDGSNVEIVCNVNVGECVTLVFDHVNQKVYWYDQATEEIKRSNINNTGSEVFLNIGGVYSGGLDIDFSASKLYFAVSKITGSTIDRINLDKSGRETVAITGVGEPYLVAVDEIAGKLYWFDGFTYHINRANLDGTSTETFYDVNGSLGYATAMVIPDNINLLPLKLVSFKGKAVNEGISLNWQTDSEINTKSFDIERADSANGLFKVIATVPSNGTGGNYAFTDTHVAKGNTYLYRLKMNDIDGKYSYSPVVLQGIAAASSVGKLSIYPNPVTGSYLYVKGLDATDNEIRTKIVNASGAAIFQGIFKVTGGQLQIPVNQLSKGIYYLHLSNKNQQLGVLKFTK